MIREESMTEYHAESNALLTSRKATAVVCLAKGDFPIKDIKAFPAESVDLPAEKPCWLRLIHSRWLECHWSCDRIIFTRILARLLTRLIGWKLFRLSYSGLLGLPMTTTLAVFQQSGKYWRLKQTFKINKRCSLIAGKYILKNAMESISLPGAALVFRELITVETSQNVTGGGVVMDWPVILLDTKSTPKVWFGKDGGSPGKKWVAQLSLTATRSMIVIPLIVIDWGRAILLDLPKKSLRVENKWGRKDWLSKFAATTTLSVAQLSLVVHFAARILVTMLRWI